MRKETVDTGILVTFRNGDTKIMQSIIENKEMEYSKLSHSQIGFLLQSRFTPCKDEQQLTDIELIRRKS